MRISFLLIPIVPLRSLAPPVTDGGASTGLADDVRHKVLAADACKQRIAIFDEDRRIVRGGEDV